MAWIEIWLATENDINYNRGTRGGIYGAEIFCAPRGNGRKNCTKFRPATWKDFRHTREDHWQTDWNSDYMRGNRSDKYVMELEESREVVGLGSYRDREKDIIVEIEYIESAPGSNPTMAEVPKYLGIGAALLAYGVQLSIDKGYGGAVFLKAKTSELWEHYIETYGAIPFSRVDPFLLLIEGDAAERLLFRFMEEVDEDDQ